MSTGGALRPTVGKRQLVSVTITPSGAGFPAHDLYVRRFWTALLGPSAITELLRIAEAARKGERIPRPIHLHSLMEVGLVQVVDGEIVVGELIPPLPISLVRRLSPALRYAHERWRDPFPAPLFLEGPPTRQTQGNQLTDHETDGHPEIGGSADDQHRGKPSEQTADPGAGELAGGTSGNQSLTHQLGNGTSNDARSRQGGDRGHRTKLAPKQQLNDGRPDEEPHQAGQPDQHQPKANQLQKTLPKAGLGVHPDQERQEPALQVVDERQWGSVEQERTEDDAA